LTIGEPEREERKGEHLVSEFTEGVMKVIRSIPKGKVLSYGRIAALAGNPGGARQVTRILHSCTRKYDLPWHRVVNSKGKIALKDKEGFLEQKRLLESEGVRFKNDDTVELNHHFWNVRSLNDIPEIDLNKE